MNTKILVDSIMRQTTVLIAQLTASAGIRAPMAHLADEVFLNLSEELESQGLSRKVVADMFGMALRGYQRRVQRLRESTTDSSTTLWQAVLDFIEQEGPLRRDEVLVHFTRDDPDAVRSVLQDLITSGLVLRQGSGKDVRLLALREEERRALARKGSRELVATMVWLDVTQHPQTTAQELAERLSVDEPEVVRTIERLTAEGRLHNQEGKLSAESLIIDVGAESGWETAVFDHFQAVCAALVAKLRRGQTRSADDDTTGGATLTFDLHAEHPELQRVQGLLKQTVDSAVEAWDAVEAYNQAHPIPADQLKQLTFYVGQSVRAEEEDE